MIIIHVEDYFDPLAGYQINELLTMSKALEDKVFLITSKDLSPFHKKVDIKNDKDFEKKTGVKILRLDTLFKLSSRIVLKNLNKTIIDINPDLVFMHGIGDFKDLKLWKKKPNYKIIRDCHMSWIASKNKFKHVYYFFYKLFFASIINRTNKYEIIYALGIEEYEYLKKIGIDDKKINYLLHGYNDANMYFNEVERRIIRKQYEFNVNDIVIAYIGKFDKSKRPDLIFDIINKFDEKYLTSISLKLLFIGPKNETYISEFNKKSEKLNNNIQIVIDDSKPFGELRKYYSASDICIFPKETTLSSIHAQVCGCPVIMENHKSNRERVANNNNLYKKNDLVDAFNILKRIIEKREYEKKNSCKALLEQREYKKQIQIIRKFFEE